jgi:drug/metabolite transporter (DMT)-like permease
MSDEDGSTPPGRRDGSAWIYLGLMILIGSSTATAAKVVLREFPWAILPLVRFGVAGLILAPVVARPLWRMVREDGARLLTAAALCVPVNQAFFLNGTRLAPTSHVGLIYAICPLIVLGFAVALGHERFRRERLLGVIASVLGVGIIALGNFLNGGHANTDCLYGDLLLVGAVTSWGAYLTINKKLVARHGGVTALAGTFLVGCALDLPIALANAGDWSRLASVSPQVWIGLAYLTLVVSVFGLVCQNLALKHVDASQLAAIGNAAPVLTIVWGVWLLGESLTPTIILGGLLTLGGIYLSGRPAPTRRPSLAAGTRPALGHR